MRFTNSPKSTERNENCWHRDEIVTELFDPDYRTPAAPGLTGGAAKLAVIRSYRTAFPDVRITVDDLVIGVDQAAVRWTLSGTDTGGFRGRPPTGRTISGWGVEMFGFFQDRIATDWIGADWLGVLIQLGVLADPWISLTSDDREHGR